MARFKVTASVKGKGRSVIGLVGPPFAYRPAGEVVADPQPGISMSMFPRFLTSLRFALWRWKTAKAS